MDRELVDYHLTSPQGLGLLDSSPYTAHAGGSACGDLLRFSLEIDGQRIVAAGFDAEGCATLRAAASLAVELVQGQDLLTVARLSPQRLADELGGLDSVGWHAVDLVADALARALGLAVYHQGELATDPERSLVAVSGGVDSSVACLLLKEAGREIVCVTLELWRDEEGDQQASCCSATAVRQARAQAHLLGLPHFTLDLRQQFRQGVVDPYLDAYRQGLTPNPCVGCNGELRIDAMIDFAGRVGATDLATGHYARLSRDQEGILLRRARDLSKDQTYMLARLEPSSLEKLRFPLGDMLKSEVRQRAAAAGLLAANKPDSQDLCFLAGTSRQRFLLRHGGIAQRPGQIVSEDGEVLGCHDDLSAFTPGQRRGIGVAGAEPYYVLAVEIETGRVIVGPRSSLAQQRVELAGVRLWRDADEITSVKLRYKQEPIKVHLDQQLTCGYHRRAQLILEDEVREGVAPGQAACLMRGDEVVGMATIAPTGSSTRAA